MTKKKYEDEIIERYVYQVKKHLPSQAKEIEEEVRGLINDMLEETCQGETPTKEEVDEVLIKLGNPAILADNYRGKARYLIGPGLFPTYLTLLKIVLPTVFFAMSIVTMIELLTEAGQAWYAYLGSWLAGVWNGLIGAFAYVTVIFAIFELKDVNTKGLQTDWSVSSLPPLPKTDAVISRGESIFSIVFYVILTTLLVAAPRLFGAFFWVDGEMTSYPVFDLEVLKTVLPLFLIGIGFGILKHVYGLIERSYNLRYAIVSTVCSLAELIISIIIFAGYPIWNQAFPGAFGDVAVIQDVWNVVTSNFVILLILIHLVELITVMYKTFKSKI
jgi:hypothetical protein